MKLNELLRLDKNELSIQTIRNYLNTGLSFDEYRPAFLYLLSIENTLGFYDIVIEEGMKMLNSFSNLLDATDYIKLLDELFIASLKLHKISLSKEFISRKKEVIPILESYKISLDKIKLKKTTATDYFSDLDIVLADVIPDEIRWQVLNDKIKYLIEKSKYEEALKVLEDLKKLNSNYDCFLEELKIYFNLQKYEEVKKIATVALEVPSKQIEAFLILLKVYTIESNHHQASILDALFENTIDEQDDIIKLEAYTLLHKMYINAGNKLSSEIYQKKIKQLQKPKKDPANKNEKTILEIDSLFKVKKVEDSQIEIDFQAFCDLLVYSHQIDGALAIREYFRLFFIEADNKFPGNEYIVYVPPYLYHYKKERLYDNKIPDFSISGTILDSVYNNKNEFADNANNLKWSKNIVTNKEYNINPNEKIEYITAVPIGEFGGILIHQQEDNFPIQYARMLAAILHAKIASEKASSKLKKDYDFLNTILNSDLIASRFQTSSYAIYNETARNLFGVTAHYNLDEFMNQISYEHIVTYRALINMMLFKPCSKSEIVYQFKDKMIKEIVYSTLLEEVYAISLFFDVTKETTKVLDMEKRSVIDLDTKIDNLYSLNNDINKYLEDKITFVLIDLDDSIKTLYGTKKSLEYFKEFILECQKYFNCKLYRYKDYTILVTIPTNDIRSVSKILKDFYNEICKFESKTIDHFKAIIAIAALRYPVASSDTNINKIYSFLDISLEKAKKSSQIHYFSYSDYEEDVFEENAIGSINTSLDNDSFTLAFNQIINIKLNKVWQYESKIVIPHLDIDSRYLLAVARKRNKIIELEKKHLELAMNFLYEVEKECGSLIKIVVPISKETFLSYDFSNYVIGLVKRFNIPKDFLRIKVNGMLKTSEFITNVEELNSFGIPIDSTSLDMVLSYPFSALHLDFVGSDEKNLLYLNALNQVLHSNNIPLIIRNIRNKEERSKLREAGITYIEGTLYRIILKEDLLKSIKEAKC